MTLKFVKNTRLCVSLFAAQKNAFFNNKLTNDNKPPKAFTKPKTQSEIMLLQKSKKEQKRPKILEYKKINRCLSKMFEKLDLFSFNKLYEDIHNNKFIIELRK